MDKKVIGARIARARDVLGLTQGALADQVDLDRTAVTRLESGERKLDVVELVRIAEVLGRPLAYFVAPDVPAVVSRRAALTSEQGSTSTLDVELQQFASEVRSVLRRNALEVVARTTMPIPQDHRGAEIAALTVRAQAGLAEGPIPDVAAAAEHLGLYTLSVGLGESDADGGCVEVEYGDKVVGAAVLNGDLPPGRRRMTLAHEIGHWVFGDAYDDESDLSAERMIDSFAIHFLAPRTGVLRLWNDFQQESDRDRAIRIGGAFRLSWTACVSQLTNLQLISYERRTLLLRDKPRAGDYMALGVRWVDELEAPYLSPSLTKAVLREYSKERMTKDRALELLRGTLGPDELPMMFRAAAAESPGTDD